MKISLITHYYNHTERVHRLIDHLSRFDIRVRKIFEIILVDDNSEELTQFNFKNLNARHYRVESAINWNQAGSRNLGVLMARGNWQLLFDVDQWLDEPAFVTVLSSLERFDMHVMYYFKVEGFIDSNLNEPLSVHPNSFLVHTQKFKEWAMYDEDFAGNYGYEDLYLPYVWEKSGGSRKLIGDTVLFKDQGFKTTNLNRSLELNKSIAERKILEGCKRPTHLLRFNWSLVAENTIDA
jgi:glycosyltransferase involved in cell wall biosynthesis